MAVTVTYTFTDNTTPSATLQDKVIPNTEPGFVAGTNAAVNYLREFMVGNVSGTLVVNVDGGAKTATYTQ